MKSSWIFVCLLLLLSLSVCAQEFKITIDAEKDAFYNTLTGPNDGWLWIPSVAYCPDNGPQPASDADLSANFYSAWDDTYFYIYEEVTDNIVKLNQGQDYWRNDCLDVKIDPDPTMGGTSTVFCCAMTALDSADVTANAMHGVANLVATQGGGWADTTVSGWPHPDDYARKLTDNGYVLELRLKWDWVATGSGTPVVIDKGPIYPAVGNTYGIAIFNDDNDLGTGRDKSIEWAAVMVDAAWNDCTKHGYFELLPDHKIKYVPQNLRNPANVNPHPEWYIPRAGPSAVSQQSAVVKNFALFQNYPNPFNPSTRIEFSVPKFTFVTVKVFNLLGEEVATLASQGFNAGRYTVDWNASGAPSGVYLYRLTAGSFGETKKMLLLR